MEHNYVVYHLHSDLSNGVTNIDSVTKFPEYITYAKDLGMKAMAFSEHGCVFAWYDKKCEIEKAGMKYIHAEEFYITEHALNETGEPVKIRDNWHCVLIAKNFEGVKEINRLASKSFNRTDGHYYYSPRIEFDDLMHISENIIVTSACLGGILNHAPNNIQEQFLKFMSEHSDRCFLEIQHHFVPDQIRYNQKLWELSKQYHIPLIAGTDTHSLNSEHARGRVMLQKAKDINFGDEEGWDLTFKSYDELVTAYRKQKSLPEDVYLEAINNTNVMADMVETFEMDRHTKYPHIYDDPEGTYKKKIDDAYKKHPYLKTRYAKEEVAKHIQEEFAVYKKTGAIDFMLLETYVREWEAENGIQSGYGRGSVSGSLIAYVLGITQMDSLKFNLNFFRFMNPDRVSNADIDTDYCSEDREKIKYFLLHDRMNLPNIKTSEIITFNTIATKGAIKDICRAMGIDLQTSQALSDSVDMDDKIPDEVRKKYPELFEYVDIVSGTIVSIGSHPSGVLVSDLDIASDVGMCSLATSDYPVSMLDMHALDALMYVKLDILGLDNIGVINKACALAGIDRLTPDNVDLNDEAVWKSIREDTTMIFQWESDSAKAYLKNFMSDETLKIAKSINPDFSYIKWFSFGNGLIRPGCASFRDDVAAGHINITGFKELDNFLAITLGRITMQEDIMKFCKDFCGYSDAESDTVRRGIAKKKGTADLIGEIHDRFLSYSHETYGVPTEKLEEIFPPIKQGILDASAYAFSWNHSDAYSCIGYISGYLRYYYPLEFLTAAFNTFTGKEDKIADITRYAKHIGVTINPIKFRHSSAAYSMDKANNAIYKGMESIKYMNKQVAEELYALRDQKFDSFIDLLNVFPGNSRQLELLIKLNFFSEFGKTQKLLKVVELYDKFHGKKNLKKEGLWLEPEFVAQYAVSETPKMFKFDTESMDKMLSILVERIPDIDIPLLTRLEAEKEYLGYIQMKFPGMEKVAVILDMDMKYSPKLKLYNLGLGAMTEIRMSKKAYQNNPFAVGELIKYTTEEKPAWKKDADDNWVSDPTKMVTWLFAGKAITEKMFLDQLAECSKER